MTLDLDDARYDFVRRVAWEKRVSVAELIRASIDLLGDDEALLDRVATLAGAEEPPPSPAHKKR
ncbi:MAG: hypothetical protein M0Z87_11955 [Actinomycetota bacterium]|nr:hypothetical protein [Actinomycetota bacterium]